MYWKPPITACYENPIDTYYYILRTYGVWGARGLAEAEWRERVDFGFYEWQVSQGPWPYGQG